ncbi:MAG: helix-turn-helix transcriptional regulator [Aestuariivita sp.]|nr:helix-turn-helix transcriptional regulator [Aestuariivita sp.]MCY4201630.1 helix-turn-helix transcriptional regulator [Aestuariivita sp.]
MIQKKQSHTSDRKVIERLSEPNYRNSFLDAEVRSWIAYQIRALRKKAGLTQVQMADRLAKPQSVISRLENTDYGSLSVNTLLDIAKSMDVALLVQFVSYPDFLERTRDKSEQAMQPDTLYESASNLEQVKTEYDYPQGSFQPKFGRNHTSAASVQDASYKQTLGHPSVFSSASKVAASYSASETSQ